VIGREAELARVERALDTVRAGGSDVLVLRGQPGIGKTALLRAAIDGADGMTVLRARGLEGEADLPFAGLAELCEPVLALRDRLPGAQAAALAGALELLQAGRAQPVPDIVARRGPARGRARAAAAGARRVRARRGAAVRRARPPRAARHRRGHPQLGGG
jgi:AAA ATPase domain